MAHLVPVGHNEIKFRASYGNGFRAPSLSEIATNDQVNASGTIESETLQEENSEGYDVGVAYHFANGSNFGIGLFQQNVENQLIYQSFSVGYIQSDEEAVSRGVEFEFEAALTDTTQITGNFTYNKAETVDNELRVRRPKRLANLGVSSRLWKDTISILANVRAVQDSIDLGGVALEDYEVVDVTIKYSPSNNFSAFLRVENLLDEDYQETNGFNTPGLAPYVSAQYSF